MKILLLIGWILFFKLSTGQYHEMLDETHYWRGVYYGFVTQDYYEHFAGDSIINSLNYKKLFSSNTLEGDQYQIALMREDTATQRVYIWQGVDKLIYDFSLEAGDTVTVAGMGGDQLITIESIGMALVGGTLRKQLNFTEAMGPATWIEGLGSLYNPANSVIGDILDFLPGVNCFYEENSLSWSNPLSSMSCELELAIGRNDILSFEIWPNPVYDVINLRYLFEGADIIEIFDMMGRRVLVQSNNKSRLAEVSIEQLGPGVYALRSGFDGRYYSLQFVKR